MKKVILPLAIASLISSTATANETVWIDSAGKTVKDGTDNCLHTIKYKSGDPECGGTAKPAPVVVAPAVDEEALLRAKLEAERKAAAAKLQARKAEILTELKDIKLKSDTSFSTGGYTLSNAGKRELDGLYNKLAELGAAIKTVNVVGHADDRGKASFNQTLSEKRANSVKQYLVQKGFDANRINTSGKGETQPIATNKTAAGRAQNRRVEISVDGQIEVEAQQ